MRLQCDRDRHIQNSFTYSISKPTCISLCVSCFCFALSAGITYFYDLYQDIGDSCSCILCSSRKKIVPPLRIAIFNFVNRKYNAVRHFVVTIRRFFSQQVCNYFLLKIYYQNQFFIFIYIYIIIAKLIRISIDDYFKLIF